jgi:hypothetical protein
MAYDAISMASKSVPPSGPLPLTNPPKTIVEKFTPEERELTCFETQIYIYLVIILTILFMIYILKKYRYI